MRWLQLFVKFMAVVIGISGLAWLMAESLMFLTDKFGGWGVAIFAAFALSSALATIITLSERIHA